MAMTSDLVSSTIVARAREPEGLRKMMMLSAVAHSIAIVGLVMGPWLFGTPRPEETIMVVSLGGGTPGPDTGGMTAMSTRPVQKAEPKDELPKPVRPTPPAAQTPAMVEPIAKPTPAKPAQRQPSQSTKVAPPSTGETVRPGQSRVETGSTSNEGGLSTGGTGGASSQGNVNFCDPQYLGQMVSLIYANWKRETAVAAKPIIRFVIQRNGTLTDITVRQPSGYYMLDFNAKRAVDTDARDSAAARVLSALGLRDEPDIRVHSLTMTHRSFLRPAVSLCAAIAVSVVALAAVPVTTPQQPPPPAGQEQAREGALPITSARRRQAQARRARLPRGDARCREQGDRRRPSARCCGPTSTSSGSST